jgi:hypothetical protein
MFSRFIDVQKKRPKKSGIYFIMYSYRNGPLRPYIAEYDSRNRRWYNTIVDVDVRYWMKNPPKMPKK